ncbi:CDP-alcohol phosphatidyltransferase family protein [uncultured Pseudokineococcus sp.]|uniref:CDP-alcohol phosphatidyltransferase family protein n=1 Tax=uncultured Pseudokineococcus sp. TaxID=1642928 RepID=UPI00261377D6|nr:CDP-alcohol phosphatidyltransferase family protein [uncultured Pseudokineococcus sp.]
MTLRGSSPGAQGRGTAGRDAPRGRGGAPATAVRDGALATAVSVVLCTGLVVLGGMAASAHLAVLAGVGLVGAAAVAVGSRRDRWSGPADRVTLGRTVLAGGCATVVVLALLGDLPPRSWWLLALAAPAALLDAVDGAVARRTGTATAAGARLDMEVDAALLLVLSVALGPVVGWWVLGVGLMRYAFVVAGRLRPRLRQPLPYSLFRRAVAAAQAVVLVTALMPVVPVPLAATACAAALALLAVSFGRDVAALERRGRAGG